MPKSLILCRLSLFSHSRCGSRCIKFKTFFLWATIFRVCVTQNGNLDGIRGHTYTRVCIAICIQRPIYRMLWVAGGKCLNNNHCNRYRGARCDLTYLTLLTLLVWKRFLGGSRSAKEKRNRGPSVELPSYRATELVGDGRWTAVGGRRLATGDRCSSFVARNFGQRSADGGRRQSLVVGTKWDGERRATDGGRRTADGDDCS